MKAKKYYKTHKKEYWAWTRMKQRCTNPNNNRFYRYSALGVSVCERWQNSFENFLADMGTAPTKKHSLDRIDNNGDYCAENCRWTTNTVQSKNRSTTRKIAYMGKTQCLKDWCKELGLDYKKVWDMMFGKRRATNFSFEQAIVLIF
jgi:hypothetical protein